LGRLHAGCDRGRGRHLRVVGAARLGPGFGGGAEPAHAAKAGGEAFDEMIGFARHG
jgi:hypothetical protein